MTAPVLERQDASTRSVLAVAGVLSGGAGVVHLGVAAAHGDHHWTMGAAFLATGWAQVAWPVVAWLRPRGTVLLAGAVVHLAALAGLVLVTLAGWPFGPLAGRPEDLSTAAVLCAGLEMATLLALYVLALGRTAVPAAVLPVTLAVVLAASSTAVLTPQHDRAPGRHGVVVAAGLVAGHSGEQPASAAEPAAPPAAGHDAAVAHDGAADPDAAPPAAGGHGHGTVDTTPPTAEQQRAADTLLAASRTTMKRYALASVAEAEGYRVVHDADGKLLHYAHDGYQADGRTVDPDRIESLLYVVLPGGGRLLVGGMFMVPRGESGPAVGGSLTPWHAHDELCLDPVQRIAITQLPGGGCPAGSAVGTTGEMMHVWAIDYPGGPFAELDAEALRTAVRSYYGLDEQTG